jgi:hypothetical protein
VQTHHEGGLSLGKVFGRTLAANAFRLSPARRSAVIMLGQGALPWINRAFGRKHTVPETWVTAPTASALVREGLATISGSGCGSWLRLTARGRLYAQALVEDFSEGWTGRSIGGKDSRPSVRPTDQNNA